ncbi:MAG: DUF4350 domain-containing protein [Sporichthyaceae bacterium]|nr:DUF4350 domain-containing protein [Sporichthyaceae bacterium]
MRRWRLPIITAVIVLLAAGLIAWSRSGERSGLLDPRSAAPSGSKALAELLRDQGVQVDLAETAADAARLAGADATLLIAYGNLVGPTQLSQLTGVASRIVVVAPTGAALGHYLPGAVIAPGPIDVRSRDPGCTLPAATAAGSARTGGVGYDLPEPRPSITVTSCYLDAGWAALAQRVEGGVSATALGTPDPLTNGELSKDGNAALAMNLLGERPHLVWYLPSVEEFLAGAGVEEPRSLWDLLPAGWKWAALQAAIAVILLALWRARRLGPVVIEPLPVVVRAAEAVEGRARLYRRITATDRAADALRAATRDRIAPMVGMTAASEPHALVGVVAERTGRPSQEIGALLYGAAPANDAALVKLADDLDSLSREVRRL